MHVRMTPISGNAWRVTDEDSGEKIGEVVREYGFWYSYDLSDMQTPFPAAWDRYGAAHDLWLWATGRADSYRVRYTSES